MTLLYDDLVVFYFIAWKIYNVITRSKEIVHY